MTPLETYLRELRDIRSSGAAVKEASYYPALSNLFNEVGKRLKPRVRCIMNLANRGAGLPDGGLFTAEQFQKPSEAEPLPGQPPARGVIEVKSTRDDAWMTADGEQVSRYWGKYRQVLVTNYRDFVLVGHDAEGKFAKLESFRLADSERAFWAAAVHPSSLSKKIEARFEEYLLRVMRHAAQLAAPEDVAWFLASYARDARARIEGVELDALATVRTALEEALGLKFEGEKGEHFFRSSLVQTLFYGVFSAWVLWAKQNSPNSRARFDWYTTARYLRVPMISKLFHLVADPQELETLKLTEVLDWAAMVLNRIDRASFFNRFQESHAVQYFYEPFLEAFDPELRKDLGVWYTPPEIVKYMVERVDTVLREELNLPDGLANKNVYVLDPCCGTGSYLVEVLDRIYRTLKERGEDALTASDLKEAAQKRVFGFEILPAPFVVSHLQVGLFLQNMGAPLSERPRERVGVYLTNALTGWEPPKGPKQRLIFPELEEERDAAEHVKLDVPILVILGNPPYNSFAGIASMDEERDLSEAYRATRQAPAPQGQGLNDLYVRFFRMAERRIVEKTGKGVVCLISNYSWLDGLSFTGMRERYLEAFDTIWIDNLHGDRIISEYAPDGRTSETVFAVQGKSPGIKIGTAISLLVSKQAALKSKDAVVLYRDMNQARADERRQALVAGLTDDHLVERYATLEPVIGIGLPFKLRALSPDYLKWPLLPDLFPVFFPGVQTKRDDFVVDIDRERLIGRVRQYFDPKVSDEEMKRSCPRAMEDTPQYQATTVRAWLSKRGFLEQYIVRHCYRPLDVQWLYWEPEADLLSRRSPDYFPQVFGENLWLVSQRKPRREWSRPQFIRSIGCLDLMDRGASCIPLYLRPTNETKPLLTTHDGKDPRMLANGTRFNISDSLLAYLTRAGNIDNAPDVFYHTLTILHAPDYRRENGGALRQDWPRIPLPDSKEALLASAALGRQIATLLDAETDVGAVREPPLQRIGTFTLPHGTTLDEAKHFAVTAGWGHAGKGGVTMPGKGKIIERAYTEQELAAVAAGLPRHPKNGDVKSPLLGDRTCDIYLNDVAYWSNIPLRVWEYTIGGYQVMKKWLSYREEKLFGRPLTKEEVRYVQEMARRIAAVLLLEPALDANYQSVKAHTFPWKG
ncbi:MAG: type ISP restriction/modification enzyme [Terriglobia bacterium]